MELPHHLRQLKKRTLRLSRMKFNKEWPIARGEAERKRFQTSKDGKLLTEGKEQAIEGEGQLLGLAVKERARQPPSHPTENFWLGKVLHGRIGVADQEPADQSQTAVTLKGKRFPRKDKVVGRLKVLFPLIKAEHKKRNSCLFKNLPRSSSGTRVSKIPGSRQMLRNGRCRSAFLDLPFQPLFDSSIRSCIESKKEDSVFPGQSLISKATFRLYWGDIKKATLLSKLRLGLESKKQRIGLSKAVALTRIRFLACWSNEAC